MHKFLIFGATGPTGIEVARRAIDVYPLHHIVLYVRSPDKVPADLSSHSNVTVVVGQLNDRAALASAMAGVTVVISTLGPSVTNGPFHSGDTPIARGYAVILEVMISLGIRRMLCLGTASIVDPNDKFNLAFKILISGVATFARNAYRDVVAIGDAVRRRGDGLEWTIVRVPVLTDKDNAQVLAGYVGDGKTNTFLTRKGFAAFVLEEVEKKAWIKKAPLICTP